MSDMMEQRARRRKMITRLVIAVVVVAAAGFAFSRFAKPEAEVRYRTAEAERGDIESSIVAIGTVEPKEYVDVGAQVSGQLLMAHFEVGDFVEQGQLLAEIDPTVAQSRVDADQAQLREMEASHRQRSAQLKLARAEAGRSEQLRNADAISQAQYESDVANLEVAEAQLIQLEAQIERLRYSLEEALANLNYTKIYAPMSGTVISQTTLEGQTINANQSAPTILTIADLSVMTVSADVSEADVPKLRDGMPAYFSTLGNPDRRWMARVRQVLPEPEVVNDVVLYKALLDVQNEDRALLPQMSATVSFVIGQVGDVVKVPSAALQATTLLFGEEQRRGGAAGGFGGEGGEDFRQRMQDATPEEREAFRQRMQQAMENGGGFPGGFPGANGDGQPTGPVVGPRQEREQVLVVMTDAGPQRREVVTGLVSRTEAEIVSGLQPGEVVVLGQQASAAGNAENGGFRGPPGGFRPF